MANPILVTGAAGRVGAVGRTVTGLLLKQGKAVRAMVRNEDERAQALRDMGAEVVVGNLLDLDWMHRVIAGCETMYFGMSVSDAYLAATVNAAALAKASQREGVHQYVADDALTDEHYRNHREPAAQAALARRAGAELVRSAGRARAADSVSRRLLPDFHFGFGQEIKSDQTTVRRGQDFAGRSGRRCTCGRRAALQSAAAHRQDLSPDRSAVREHAFPCTGVFEGAWPHDHLSGHSGRAVAGRAARAGLTGSPGEPPRDDGRSASRGTLRPDVGRRAHANGARAAERAGVRQEECGDIHRVRKRGLSVAIF
jgi:hypothetical protein